MNPVRVEADLHLLISNGIEESITLDYKAAGALSKSDGGKKAIEVTKDVSALANADGGTIIYGIREDAADKHKLGSIDPIDGTIFSKEWLEHIINNIRPRLDARIFPVRLSVGTNGVCYVVEVPKGETAHQAADQKYYRRFNFESVAMHDHEVRDVMNRRKYAKVELTAKLVQYSRPTADNDGVLAVTLLNESDVLGLYFVVIVEAPPRVKGRIVFYRESTYDFGPHGRHYHMRKGNALGSPLFPRDSRRLLFPFCFIQTEEAFENEMKSFNVTTFVDTMPKQAWSFDPDVIYEKSS